METDKASSIQKSGNLPDKDSKEQHGRHSPAWAPKYTISWNSDQLTLSSANSVEWTVTGIKTTASEEKITIPAGCVAEIVRMKKSDGLPVWITHHQSVGWIIKVADRCRAFRDYEDAHQKFVPKNEADGYTYPVAKLWFRTISGLSKAESKRLHEELQIKTLIGDYTGHLDTSNIIKYETPEIFFYTMTLNAKSGVLVPPSTFFDFCEEFGLDYAEFEAKDKITSEVDLKEKLEEYGRVAQGNSMAEVEEGYFLYVVVSKGKLEKVNQVRFVKNLEFTLYSSLKKLFVDSSSTSEKSKSFLEAFGEEIQHIAQQSSQNLPQPLNFYKLLAEVGQKALASQEWVSDLATNDFGFLTLKLLDSIINRSKLSKIPFSQTKLSPLWKHQKQLYNPANAPQMQATHQEEPNPNPQPTQAATLQPTEDHNSTPIGLEQSTIPTDSRASANPTTNTNTAPTITIPTTSSTNANNNKGRTHANTPGPQPLSPPHALHRRLVLLLPVLPPAAGLSSFVRLFSERIGALDAARVFQQRLGVVSVEWGKCVAAAAEEVGGLQHKLSAEGEKQLLAVTALQGVVRSVFEGVASRDEDERVVVLVDKAFTLEAAKNFIESFRPSVAKGSTFEPSIICLAAASAGGSEEKIDGLALGPTAIATIIDRKLQGLDDTDARVAVTDILLNSVQIMRGVQPNAQSVKSYGFDGFIGFPFFNLDWEDEVPSRKGYDVFKTTLHYLLKTEDPDDPQRPQELQMMSQITPQLVLKLQNWWEIEDPEQPGTSLYDVFLAKSISSVYKKFDGIKPNPMQMASPADQKKVQISQPVTTQTSSHQNHPNASKPDLTTEQRLAQILKPQIEKNLIPIALEAMSIAKSYDTIAERDSIAIKSALQSKPSSWTLSDPALLPVSSSSPPPPQLEIVAFAYLPAWALLALPKHPHPATTTITSTPPTTTSTNTSPSQQQSPSPVYLTLAESSSHQLSPADTLALAHTLHGEPALGLRHTGPVEELTALRVEGRLVYVLGLQGPCVLNCE